ncbi:hypothetical protein EMCRGX_G029239 [Ephydatia muelleri]
MEEMGALPAPDTVLNKLKSDGTFDQFRKSCLSALESEPSFTAQGEHIANLSRRYLQNFNWRDSVTKNDARSRLKNYILGVMAGRSGQNVGIPLESLVGKVLEAKTKELLPKIVEIIDTLTVKSPAAAAAAAAAASSSSAPNADHPPGGSQQSSGTVSAVSLAVSDRGNLPLPIDIPGMSAPKRRVSETSSHRPKPKAVGDGNKRVPPPTGDRDGKKAPPPPTVKSLPVWDRASKGEAANLKDRPKGEPPLMEDSDRHTKAPVKDKMADGIGEEGKDRAGTGRPSHPNSGLEDIRHDSDKDSSTAKRAEIAEEEGSEDCMKVHFDTAESSASHKKATKRDVLESSTKEQGDGSDRVSKEPKERRDHIEHHKSKKEQREKKDQKDPINHKEKKEHKDHTEQTKDKKEQKNHSDIKEPKKKKEQESKEWKERKESKEKKEQKDHTEMKELKDRKEQELKERKEHSDHTELREPKERKDVKEKKVQMDSNESKEKKDHTEMKELKDRKEQELKERKEHSDQTELREPKERKDVKEKKEQMDSNESKEKKEQELKERKERKEKKEHRELTEHTGMKEPKEKKEQGSIAELKDKKEHLDHMVPEESRERKEVKGAKDQNISKDQKEHNKQYKDDLEQQQQEDGEEEEQKESRVQAKERKKEHKEQKEKNGQKDCKKKAEQKEVAARKELKEQHESREPVADVQNDETITKVEIKPTADQGEEKDKDLIPRRRSSRLLSLSETSEGKASIDGETRNVQENSSVGTKKGGRKYTGKRCIQSSSPDSAIMERNGGYGSDTKGQEEEREGVERTGDQHGRDVKRPAKKRKTLSQDPEDQAKGYKAARQTSAAQERPKPSPVVVTRYNRQVKRNRRYSPSSEFGGDESPVVTDSELQMEEVKDKPPKRSRSSAKR